MVGLEEVTEPTEMVDLTGCFSICATVNVAEEKASLGFFWNDTFDEVVDLIICFTLWAASDAAEEKSQ